MPWTPRQFRERHNRRASGPVGKKAAGIANAMLRSGIPEGEAIATASKYVAKKQGRSTPSMRKGWRPSRKPGWS